MRLETWGNLGKGQVGEARTGGLKEIRKKQISMPKMCNISIEFGGSHKSKGKCYYLNQNTYLWLGRFWVYTYVYIVSDIYIYDILGTKGDINAKQ